MPNSTRQAGSQRFRQRKLNTKTALEVVREDQLDTVDSDQQNTHKVETGVEKHEETEHHLQAAISASQAAAVGGNVAQIYIPTPETVQSSVPYDQLYTAKFSQPTTYIRFSSTVEDCTGCPYNMSEEDDHFLKEMNEKAPSKNAATQCSEDQFEVVMDFFETTSKSQQPFSTVGDSPVLSWEEMFNAFDENIDEPARVFAKDVYEYWKSRRLQSGNTPLQPSLKIKVIETATDADDSDPYVCFRRREVRQARKTRGRDAQSVEKLKKLRKELEEARHLVALVKQREILKRDSLVVDRQLYEQRTSLRHVKRLLPGEYKDGDEDLLINQRPPKRPAIGPGVPRQPATQLKLPPRADGRSSDADLVLLSDVIADKENAIQREIKDKIRQHQKWNEHYVDLTRAPLTPPPEENFNSFRPAVTEYLPTPPASESSEQNENAMEVETPKQQAVSVRYAAPSPNSPNKDQPAFRRRVGRGGRILIDRRGMCPHTKTISDSRVAERFRHDDDGDDDDEPHTYTLDPYDIASMRYRAAISGSHPSLSTQQAQAMRRAQIEQQQAEAARHASQGAVGGSTSQSGHRVGG